MRQSIDHQITYDPLQNDKNRKVNKLDNHKNLKTGDMKRHVNIAFLTRANLVTH